MKLSFEHISKLYGDTAALQQIDLTLGSGVYGLLGPNGAGKTTLMRIMTDLLAPSTGRVLLDGQDIAVMGAAFRKKLGYLPQDFGVYPNFTAEQFLLYIARLKGLSKFEAKRQTDDLLHMVGLEDKKQKKLKGFSGGQRQRVAMGRAIVRDAKVFLMDEPLSNLDAKLRVAMRAEIAKIHRRIGATTIYVTHDQTEAMTLADRIVIMSATPNPDKTGSIGRIEQIGTPQELYNEPANKFVAGFIGSPAMNFFEVIVEKERLVNQDGLSLALPQGQEKILEEKGYLGKKVTLGIRPEDISSDQIVHETFPNASVTADILVSELLGSESMLYVKFGSTEFTARVNARDSHSPGEKVQLTFNIAKGHFFDLETEKRIN